MVNSLVVQWLKLPASHTQGTSLVSGQGTKISNMLLDMAKKLKKKFFFLVLRADFRTNCCL